MWFLVRLSVLLALNVLLAVLMHKLDPEYGTRTWFVICCALDGVIARARLDEYTGQP